ncbi:hypothetical protein [Halocatena marina]|uniref:Uncharacterized protein n=1 Tax=Halocatena marina TaxID=2934937 RepID=A0ABD5YT30_9EURY|nr:hypothetical protein [Halocatena marina]
MKYPFFSAPSDATFPIVHEFVDFSFGGITDYKLVAGVPAVLVEVKPDTVFSPIPEGETPFRATIAGTRGMWDGESRCDFRDRCAVVRFGQSNNLEYFSNRTNSGPRRRFSIIWYHITRLTITESVIFRISHLNVFNNIGDAIEIC